MKFEHNCLWTALAVCCFRLVSRKSLSTVNSVRVRFGLFFRFILFGFSFYEGESVSVFWNGPLRNGDTC